ncbi:MAG TPA: hypothetical protein VM901_00550 [Bdellovibrionota bacterium]|jgi:hypothetical protein|nr:hypothetical protein [Bdellovibrionota bacterium]
MRWGNLFLILVSFFTLTHSHARLSAPDLQAEFPTRARYEWPTAINGRLWVLLRELGEGTRDPSQISVAASRLGQLQIGVAHYRWDFVQHFDFMQNYFLLMRLQDALPEELRDASMQSLLKESFASVVRSMAQVTQGYVRDFEAVAAELDDPRFWKKRLYHEAWQDQLRIGYPTGPELSEIRQLARGSRWNGREKLQRLKDLKGYAMFQMEYLALHYDEVEIAEISHSEMILWYQALGIAAAELDERALLFFSSQDLGNDAFAKKLREIQKSTRERCALTLAQAALSESN